ncbi:MAG TPA: hypothetical protein VGL44_11420 [Gaiellales bacterium]|jgi:hypothetical protein
MAPSEITHALHVVDERLQAAYTVAASLLIFAVASVVGAFALHGLTGLAAASAVLAAVGALGAMVASRMLEWKRCDLYDEIVLSGFRHVGGPAVARHAADLVSAARRQMFAATLERFLEIAMQNQIGSVPLDRKALRELEPHIRGLCSRVRALDAQVDAAGMVLLRRLLTDGATSPLFRLGGPKPELERALERIHAQLGPMPVIQLFPATSTEPLRIAA